MFCSSTSSREAIMSFWQENLPFIKGFFDERSTKFLELMDNAEKAIDQVNADQIYTSKQFMRIRDNFYVSIIGDKEL